MSDLGRLQWAWQLHQGFLLIRSVYALLVSKFLVTILLLAISTTYVAALMLDEMSQGGR